MTPERVVALHSGATYRAYMYGFLPGFCYLGGLPKELTVARRVTIRAAASVRHDHDRRRHGTDHDLRDADRLVAGRPHAGAHVLARTRKQTFLAAVGDEIKFEPIDLDTFHALDRRAAAGEIVATMKKLA